MARKTRGRSAARGSARRKASPKPAKAKARTQAKAKNRRAARRTGPPAPAWKPAGSQQVIVNLVSSDASAAIDFYKIAFGAIELSRMTAPGGRGVWHAELRIGDSVVYINDAMPGGPTEAPGPGRKPTAGVQLYVPDVDAVFDRAVRAGATPGMPVADQFWGDRMGMVIDPFGQTWGILTRVKVMSEEEQRKAGEEFAAKMAQRQNGGQPGGTSAAQ